MNFHQIIESLSSTEDAIILENIYRWINNDISTLETCHTLKRNIFHYLIINKKNAIFIELSENKNHHSYVLKADSLGQTIIHFCVKHEKAQLEALEYIATTFPQLINAKNTSGNSPLHVAASHNRLWAVSYLLDKGASIDAINNIGLMPYELCSDLFLKKILNPMNKSESITPEQKNSKDSTDTINFSENNYFNLKKIKLNENNESNELKLQELKNKFPSLIRLNESTSDSSLSPLNVSESSDSLCSYLSEALLNDENINLSGNHDDILKSLFTELLGLHKEGEASFHYNGLQKKIIKFILSEKLIKFDDILDGFRLYHSINEIIINILGGMKQTIEDQYTRFQEKCLNLENKFISYLRSFGVMEKEKRNSFPVEKMNKENIFIFKNLWEITACDKNENDQSINLKTITYQSMALLSKVSLDRLLSSIQILYPYFSYRQKLIANFIVHQMVNYNGICYFDKSPMQSFWLRKFYKINADNNSGLGDKGEKLNQILENIAQITDNFIKNNSIQNYIALNKYLDITPKLSFSDILVKTIESEGKEQEKYISIVVNDLKYITTTLYQQLQIIDFNIEDKISKTFNILNNYFINFILNQGKNILKAIKTFIRIAQAIFSQQNSVTCLDINSFMLVSNVLNHYSISRLKDYIDKLSQEEKDLIKSIEDLASPNNNSKNIRKLLSISKFTLPFPAIIMKDIFFANEGNKNIASALLCIGSILSKLLHIKITIRFEINNAQTDINNFMHNYSLISEDLYYIKSVRLQLRESDHIDLSTCEINDLTGIKHVINKIKSKLNEEKIIPAIKYKKSTYMPYEFLSNFIKWFENQISRKFNIVNYDILITNQLQSIQPEPCKLYIMIKSDSIDYLALGMNNINTIKKCDLSYHSILNTEIVISLKDKILNFFLENNREEEIKDLFTLMREIIEIAIKINNEYYSENLNHNYINEIYYKKFLNSLEKRMDIPIQNRRTKSGDFSDLSRIMKK